MTRRAMNRLLAVSLWCASVCPAAVEAQTPLHAYFRRIEGGWKLVGLERTEHVEGNR